MTQKRDSATWPTGAALVHSIRSADVEEGTAAFWHLGQASWIVKSARATIAFDLFLMPSSGQLQRRFEPPVTPAELDFLDVAFCSHDHLDHLDRRSLRHRRLGRDSGRHIVLVHRPDLPRLFTGAFRQPDSGCAYKTVRLRPQPVNRRRETVRKRKHPDLAAGVFVFSLNRQ